MRQEQRKALALAAVLALSSLSAAGQVTTGHAPHRVEAASRAADAGYKAYARRDYAAAVQDAQRAVEGAPRKRAYWLLLAQALAADGQLARADEALRGAAALKGDDAALARARADVARMHAQAAGDAMYKALAAGDVKAAVAQGTEAVRWAPENAGYRLVLVQALLRDGRYADADRIATETVALLPESAAPLALRGYAHQALDRPADARADLDRALQQKGLPAPAQRQLRLLAADLALAQGDGQRALDLLQALPRDDADAATRRELARQRLAGAGTPFALRAPGIDCSNVDAAQTCTLQAAAVPAAPGYANATAAYRALEEKDVQRALTQARLATAASPSNRDWQLMHLNAALAAHEDAEAERAATAALDLRSDAQTLAQRSAIRRRLGDVAGANMDAEAALQMGGLPTATAAGLLADLGRKREARELLASAPAATATPQGKLEEAYIANRIGDAEAARQAFAAADAAGGLPPTSLLDAGYAAMHSKHDQEALGYFHRAIDAVNGLQLKLDPQMVYDVRRTNADLERRWGVLASLTMRNAGGVVPGIGVVGGPTGSRTTQAGAEVYYRPWGWRNGEFVEFFARGFVTLDNEAGGFTGGDSFSGALGARWKPFSSQNFILSLSRVFGPNVNDDWLAQVGYSWDYGNDLRVDTPSWWTHRFYGEVGRYLDAGNDYGLAYLWLGRQYLVGNDGRTTLYPHLFAGVEYNSTTSPKTASGTGPGISLRHWFREDVYTAPRSYWDVTAQYRFRLSGDDRLQGLYLNAFLNY